MNDNVFKSVVQDELERNLRKQVVFNNEFSKLPKGSLSVIEIHGDKYLYRKYRNNSKIISEYIGPVNSEEAKRAYKQRDDYLKIKQDLKDLKREEMDLRRFLKLYD